MSKHRAMIDFFTPYLAIFAVCCVAFLAGLWSLKREKERALRVTCKQCLHLKARHNSKGCVLCRCEQFVPIVEP